jgi:hypothetical protein
MKRLLGALLMTLVLGLAAASPAIAGGGPGGSYDYFRFTPGSFTLTRQGEVVLTGTVTSTLPGEARVSAGVEQVAGTVTSDNPYDYQYAGLIVSGGNAVDLVHKEPTTQEVTLVITADHPRGFRPGEARVFLEFEYVAHDPATGYDYPASQFGIINITLSVAH